MRIVCVILKFFSVIVFQSAGITSLADNPSDTLKYLAPLLDYASDHIPFKKHPETPLYILATAGMRMLPQRWVQDFEETTYLHC